MMEGFIDFNFLLLYVVVLDTNIWYHKTSVLSEGISITIGSEYD